MSHRKYLSLFPYLVYTFAILVSFELPTLGLMLVAIGVAAWLTSLRSSIGRLLIGLLLSLVFNGLIYEVFSLINFNPDIKFVGLAYVIIGILLIRKGYGNGLKLTAVGSPDITVIITALLALGFLLYPVLINNPFPSRSDRVLHLMSSGEDNASHYALFKYAYVHDSYSYGKTPQSTGLISTLVNYPQASEFDTAWLAKGLLGNKYADNNRVLSEAYYGLSSVFFAILISLCVLIATELYLASGRKFGLLEAVSAVLLAAAALIASPLLELMGRGFQSQIAAYIYLMGMLYLLTTKASANLTKLAGFLATVGLFAGVCTSWWFLAPIAVVPLLTFAWYNRSVLSGQSKIRIAGLVAVLLLSIYPILLNYTSSSTSTSINQKGGVDKIAFWTLTFYVLAVFGVVMLKKVERKKFSPLLFCVSAWIIFTGLLGLYQKITVGHFEYYFYKSLYTLIPLGAVVLIYIGMRLMNRLFSLGIYRKVAIVVLLTCIFVMSLLVIKPLYPRVYVHDWFNNPLSSTYQAELFSQSLAHNYRSLFFLGGCSPGTSYTADRWAGAFLLSENDWSSKIELATLGNKPSSIMSALSAVPANKNSVRLYLNTNCPNPALNNFIESQGFKVTHEYRY